MAILSRIQREYTNQKERKKKEKTTRNTFQGGATVDAKNYSVKSTYCTYRYLPYLSYAHRVG